MTVQIDRCDVSYWDPNRRDGVTPAGDVPVYVGGSATDTQLVGTLRVQTPPL
jgi:beta-glucosidase